MADHSMLYDYNIYYEQMIARHHRCGI